MHRRRDFRGDAIGGAHSGGRTTDQREAQHELRADTQVDGHARPSSLQHLENLRCLTTSVVHQRVIDDRVGVPVGVDALEQGTKCL